MATKNKATAANPADTIGELVEKRDLLLEQRNLVAGAPRAFVESEADIAHVVGQLAAGVEIPVGRLGQGAAGVGELVHLLSRTDQQEYRSVTAAQLLAWALPDLLAQALQRDLELAYQALPKPMSSADRLSELAKLDRGIAATEADIASAWWQAIDAGMALDPPPVSGATLIGLVD